MTATRIFWLKKFAWKPTRVENLDGSTKVIFMKSYMTENSDVNGKKQVRNLAINKYKM